MRRQAVRLPRACGLLALLAGALVLLTTDAEAAKDASRHRVDVAGTTKSTGSPAPGTIEDRGTITGKPFGAGTIKVLATFGPDQTMDGSFKIRTPRGSALGTVATHYVVDATGITFTGTATFAGGKGRYEGIRGKKLDVYDHNTLDGQSGEITLKGRARF